MPGVPATGSVIGTGLPTPGDAGSQPSHTYLSWPPEGKGSQVHTSHIWSLWKQWGLLAGPCSGGRSLLPYMLHPPVLPSRHWPRQRNRPRSPPDLPECVGVVGRVAEIYLKVDRPSSRTQGRQEKGTCRGGCVVQWL